MSHSSHNGRERSRFLDKRLPRDGGPGVRKIQDQELLNSYIEQHSLQELCGADLASIASLYRFERDELILSTTQVPRHIYFLVNGRARVFSYTVTSQTLTCRAESGFAIFGEAAALWGNLPSNNVQALEPCDCVGISLSRHRSLLLDDVVFLRYVARTLAKRLTDEKARANLDPLDVRLAGFVLLHEHQGVFTTKLTDAAKELNVSYRHLLRVIGELCARGYIVKQGRGSYAITSPDRLAALADGMQH